MRDGITLNMLVVVPDLSPNMTVGAVVMRTPYGVDSLSAECLVLAQIGWACSVAGMIF
jgi:hypothetical protein